MSQVKQQPPPVGLGATRRLLQQCNSTRAARQFLWNCFSTESTGRGFSCANLAHRKESVMVSVAIPVNALFEVPVVGTVFPDGSIQFTRLKTPPVQFRTDEKPLAVQRFRSEPRPSR